MVHVLLLVETFHLNQWKSAKQCRHSFFILSQSTSSSSLSGDIYTWTIWAMNCIIFFKSPLMVNSTGWNLDQADNTHSWRHTVNTTLKSQSSTMIPGKDERNPLTILACLAISSTLMYMQVNLWWRNEVAHSSQTSWKCDFGQSPRTDKAESRNLELRCTWS